MKMDDKREQFNDAYGDGFGDYVLANLSLKKINVSIMKADLIPWCRNPEFFTAYCVQQYNISVELSERLRQTLLKEMKPKRD